jgi:hypothetical protein
VPPLRLVECKHDGEAGRVSSTTSVGVRMRAWLRVAFVLAACVAAAACGSGEDGGDGGGEGAAATTVEERLTREEYIAAADAICKDANDRVAELADPESADELITFIQQARAIGREQLIALRELSPPEDIEARVEEAYALIEDQLALTEELEQAAEDEDLERVEELVAEGDAIDDEADAIAAEIGLVECGSS